MKINWQRKGTFLEGHVGDVLCFYVIKQGDKFELVCDLPEAVPNAVGRYVVAFPDPKQAVARAGQVFKHWLERFNR